MGSDVPNTEDPDIKKKCDMRRGKNNNLDYMKQNDPKICPYLALRKRTNVACQKLAVTIAVTFLVSSDGFRL